MIMKTTDIGKIGEDAAVKYLKEKKYKIIERNLHISHNEIDIIAIDKKEKTITFVEVKARSVDEDLYSPFGVPAEAVTLPKQRRTIEAARKYLTLDKKYQSLYVRFDVIEIYLSKIDKKVLQINHIENAFGG